MMDFIDMLTLLEIHQLLMNLFVISFKLLFVFLMLYCCSFSVFRRGCSVQWGVGLSDGSAVEGAQQSVQSQTQLYYFIDRSVSELFTSQRPCDSHPFYSAFTKFCIFSVLLMEVLLFTHPAHLLVRIL